MADSDWVEIWAPNQIEAEIAVELLTREGIPARIKALRLTCALGGVVSPMTTRVLVPAERADEARGWLEPGPDAEGQPRDLEGRRGNRLGGQRRRVHHGDCVADADLARVEDGGAQAAAVGHCLERARAAEALHVGAGVTRTRTPSPPTSPTRKR